MISKNRVYKNIVSALLFSVMYFLIRVFLFHPSDKISIFIGSIGGGFVVFLVSIIFAKPVENN